MSHWTSSIFLSVRVCHLEKIYPYGEGERYQYFANTYDVDAVDDYYREKGYDTRMVS